MNRRARVIAAVAAVIHLSRTRTTAKAQRKKTLSIEKSLMAAVYYETYAAKNKYVLILIRNCKVGIGFGLVRLLAIKDRSFPKLFFCRWKKTHNFQQQISWESFFLLSYCN